MIKYAEFENSVNQQIKKVQDEVIIDNRRKLREIKNILKTPRLYEYYRQYLILAEKKEVLKTYIAKNMEEE